MIELSVRSMPQNVECLRFAPRYCRKPQIGLKVLNSLARTAQHFCPKCSALGYVSAEHLTLQVLSS